MQVGFDEFNLDINLVYRGRLMEFPTERPDKSELRANPMASVQLAGFLVRQYADRVTAVQEGESCRIELHFDH